MQSDSNYRLTAIIFSLCIPAFGLAQEATTDEERQPDPEAAATDAAVPEEEPVELAEQVVTGSRLEGGDPSARIYSFTAEDIAVRGVSTVEEFFRTLPWTYPSITTQTNTSLHFDGTDQDEEYIELGLGISTVNLRNLGSANTLVLMNGRRIAGAGEEDDFANILNVPLSAIERVDIQLDGASAVYGSDAIGGVVNFITKKNYTGLSVDYRQELSSTDANQTTASITGGYAWGTGNVTAIASRETSDAITNSKTGLNTLDFRPRLGPEFDLRSFTVGQPGVVCEFEAPTWAPTLYRCVRNGPRYQLPANHSGVGATVDDFIVFARGEPSPLPYDALTPQNGEESTTDSLTVSVEQYVTDNLRVYADVVYSTRDSYQEYTPQISGVIPVPSTNAYNPFGRPMLVQYSAVRESEAGLLPAAYTEAQTTRRDLNFGVLWAFAGSHELGLDITRTKSERESYRLRARGRREQWDPTADAYYAALSSSDPNTALNFFGNGEGQTAAFNGFLTTTDGPITGDSETSQYNLTLRGSLLDLWGGRASYTVGTEYRENIIFQTKTATASSSGLLFQTMEDSGSKIGVDRPSREISAYYAELALPLVGPENSLRGVHSLILSLQARHDQNESRASAYIGTRGAYLSFEDLAPRQIPYWHPEDGWLIFNQRRFVFHYADVVHDFNYTTAKQTRISPTVGLRYQPTENFTLRARWSRAFRAPVWSDQYATCIDPPPDSFCSPDTRFRTSFTGVDPYHPNGTTEFALPFGGAIRQVYNTDLKNEYSDTTSLGFDWIPETIPGLRLIVDWSETSFTNRIEDGVAVAFMAQLRPELIMNHPQVVTRNAAGEIESLLFLPINLNEKYSELLDASAEYNFSTDFGSFTPRIAYTRILADYQQVGPTDESRLDFVGTMEGPDKYQLEGSLDWLWNQFAASVFVYYTPAYENDRARYCSSAAQAAPNSRCAPIPWEWLSIDVSSLTTVDLTATYRMDNGLRLRVGGRNILDRAAPANVYGGNLPYDPTRWDARGQVLFLDLNWEM
ncbi:MAG: TonB-dependent receptor [Gammaproteobacteria bacterium]|nr:TonB-dependent receptor [Gammaproteobacteria bacterium]